jgi:hypothetical protein
MSFNKKVGASASDNSQLLPDPFLPNSVVVDGVFPNLTLRALSRFKQTSTFFCQVIHKNPDLSQLLSQIKVSEWALKQTFNVNPGFLWPFEAEASAFCQRCMHFKSQFSLQTLRKLASYLTIYQEEQGRIPPCGLGVHQPRELNPAEYVRGILDVNDEKNPLQRGPKRIFFHLYEIQGSPRKADLKHGEKAFFHVDGHSSTDLEKARAIERYVFERYLDRPLWFCKES